ncbi:DUF3784 domain-containing protein [Halococcus saccharolyticus]|uniref:DUF3784 domain-containing protein n=1 Tax=Halococcus saccharolyticus DSM 5350 TaxID=1227455 RepID=M0MM59_9EURY|nr:DUF3784 domain-containing protein [Halococcus saccharolyticus]EMA46761.1 hypothetical protein C449_03806 [Halococcus saccharolyticus DSM 5350]
MDPLVLPESGALTVLVGLGVLVLGYLIKFRGWTFLLAGYDPNAVTDEAALADLAGGTIIRIGLTVVVFGIVTAVGATSSLLDTVFAIAILVAAVRLVYRVRKHTTA